MILNATARPPFAIARNTFAADKPKFTTNCAATENPPQIIPVALTEAPVILLNAATPAYRTAIKPMTPIIMSPAGFIVHNAFHTAVAAFSTHWAAAAP